MEAAEFAGRHCIYELNLAHIFVKILQSLDL